MVDVSKMGERSRLARTLALESLAAVATLVGIDVVARSLGVEHNIVEKLMEIVLLTIVVLPLATIIPLASKRR